MIHPETQEPLYYGIDFGAGPSTGSLIICPGRGGKTQAIKELVDRHLRAGQRVFLQTLGGYMEEQFLEGPAPCPAPNTASRTVAKRATAAYGPKHSIRGFQRPSKRKR
jgi:hypothetical protein